MAGCRLLFLLAFLALPALGCGVEETQQIPAAASGSADFVPEIVLEEASRARLDELIVAQRGKVVLVDYWASW